MWDYIATELLLDDCIRCVVFKLFNLVKSYSLPFSLFTIILSVILLWFLRAYIHNIYDEKQNTSTNLNWIKILSSHSISFSNKRFLLVFLPLLFTFSLFLVETRYRKIDRASNAFAQTESFLREQYPDQEEINTRKNEPYYGSAIELRKSLNFLHEIKREFTFLYLPKAELGLVELSCAVLWYANFSHAYLSNANFIQADLNKANLIGSNLSKANLSRADLYGAEFNEANMKEANLTGAVITATDFTDAKNLTKEQIMGTCWLRAGTYIVDGKKIIIKDDASPILPDNDDFKGFNVHGLPKAKLGDKRGDIAYCP